MKEKYLLIVALIAVTVLGAGCSKEESSTLEDSGELGITTNIKNSNRSITTSFSNSIIGVYVDDNAAAYSPTTSSTASVSTGDNSATVTPSIYINADATVYAWSPATDDELTSPTNTSSKDITVVNNDDFSATDQTDYLYATPVDVTKANRIAELTFKHALSKIIFKVNKDENFTGTGDLTKISLMASDDAYKFLSGNGTMGIADGVISGLKTIDSLTYTGSSSITDTTTVTEIVVLVAPTTLAASTSATSTITITLTIDGTSYPATFPVSKVSAWAAGNVYTYNITVNNKKLEISHYIQITDWESNTTTADLTLKIPPETANCYMIAPDNSLEIPVNVRGNGVVIIDEVSNPSYVNPSISPLSVGILWQTSPDLISLGTMNSDDKVIITANSVSGNAVIAVYDGENQSGNILWSWHIWVTDYDPNADTPLNGKTYPLDNSAGESYVFMDRNLGATTVTPNTVSTLGLLYQWGRKDPFPASSSTSAITEPTMYNASGSGSTNMVSNTEVSVTSNLDNAILHPLTFYLGTSANAYDWYSVTASTHNDALWGGALISTPSVKTMFDPSPAGWRVPTWKGSASPWTAFTTITFSWNATYHGRTYTDGSFYPAVGYRKNSSGALYNVGGTAYYWSGSPRSSTGYYLIFGNNNVYPPCSDYRANGFSVRCVQDK